MRFTLEGVEALEAIARTGTFAAAAAELHKVPSAVSYQVRQLEEGLGVELFDRSGHKAVLTAAGVALLDEGRFLLARARRMEQLAARFAADWEARLMVVVDGALPTAPLLRALAELGAADLPTHVQLRTEFLAGVPQHFDELQADLMLTLVTPDDPLLERVELPAMSFVLVAAPTHPAAGVSLPDLAALQQHLELSVHDSDAARSHQDTNLIPGARVFYVGDFAAKKEGLLRGLGLGWMPLPSVADELGSGALVELDYGLGSRRSFPLTMVTRRDRPLGPAGRRLHGLLRAALQEDQAPTHGDESAWPRS